MDRATHQGILGLVVESSIKGRNGFPRLHRPGLLKGPKQRPLVSMETETACENFFSAIRFRHLEVNTEGFDSFEAVINNRRSGEDGIDNVKYASERWE